MAEKLRVLDLFSGIGGFSLGLERTGGFETIGFCEIDPFCREVLAKHWPDVPCHDDITTMEFSEGMADVITGGFPCQDISLAGKGAGLAGERSGLWRELVRAIRLVRPRYAIVENVAALLNRGMGRVLGDLAEIGHNAEWHCIPASAVGAPHRRDRVWIITNADRASGQQYAPSGEGSDISRLLSNVADANSERLEGQRADTYSQRRQEPFLGSAGLCNGASDGQGWWRVEPDVGRVAHGIPQRVDRLRSLGNAVVAQIPELIGRAILEAEHG